MTLSQAIDHVRQNIAEKLSGDAVIAQTAFLTDAINLFVLPDLVSSHDWSWKYDYVDQALASGTHTFTPNITSLGAGILIDDLYAIILRTGSLGTSKRIRQRGLKWFLDRFPDHTLEAKGRAEWFTIVGAPGETRFEAWLSQPTDAAYTARLVVLKTFGGVGLTDPLPFRSDKHMLVVAGATSYAFASIEQFEASQPWLQLYLTGMAKWWEQDQAMTGVETNLGMYRPRSRDARGVGDFWANPFVRSVE